MHAGLLFSILCIEKGTCAQSCKQFSLETIEALSVYKKCSFILHIITLLF